VELIEEAEMEPNKRIDGRAKEWRENMKSKEKRCALRDVCG